MSALAILSLPGGTLAAQKVEWKPVKEAMLRVDDRPPKLWNVYQIDKKDQRLLAQLGRRFLFLDVRAKQIYELDPARLESRNDGWLWQESDKPEKPLPTEDWIVRDVGPARRIRVKLAAEGRILEIQLPIPPDLRWAY